MSEVVYVSEAAAESTRAANAEEVTLAQQEAIAALSSAGNTEMLIAAAKRGIEPQATLDL